MKNVFLLTISDLEELLKKGTDLSSTFGGEYSQIRLYYRSDEYMPIQIVEKINNLNIIFVCIDSETEIIFDLGKLMGESVTNKSDIEIFCSSYINVPDSLVKALNVKKIKQLSTQKKSAVKSVSRKTVTKKDSDMVKSMEYKKTVSKKTATVKDEAENTVKANTKNENSATKERVEETQGSQTSNIQNSDVAATFFKQMTVRSDDLQNFDGDDNVLTKKLIEIFRDENIIIASELRKILNDNFSETDANTIYKWVKPNIKRLHALAIDYFSV